MRALIRTLTSTVFIAAAAGFVLARQSGSGTSANPVPLSKQARTADFSVSYPADWRIAPAVSVPGVPLHGSLTLAPTRVRAAELVIGTAPLDNPGALPPHLRAALALAPRPEIVTLGPSSFVRYLNLTPRGQNASESIYDLPTTVGNVTAVCSALGQNTSFTSSCERVLATVKLNAGRVLSLTPDAGYALELNRILGELNAVRRQAGPGLRSPDAAVLQRSAMQLAHADDRAASEAHHITSAAVSLANVPLENALRMNAAAYRALARAAGRQDPVAYRTAEAGIGRSGRALAAVYAQLRGFGYRIGAPT